MPTRTAPTVRSPLHRALAFAMLVSGLAGSTARADLFTVGGGGCTHADLSSALTAAAANPGSDEIRLLANTSHQGPFILASGAGLALRGGFPSCGAATPTGFSTLLGTNSSRAASLLASTPMSLDRLTITGGTVTGDGGGLHIQGASFVNLADVLVFGNTATGRGGNIFVSGSPGLQVLLYNSSIVSAGTAANGGGLACSGDGLVRLYDDTVITNNTASNNGGGVYLENGCSLSHNAGGTLGGILTNTAGQNGGGVAIESGAELNTGFDGFELSMIQGNSATGGGGGGVWVNGSGSVLRAFFTEISGNSAHFYGGAVMAQGGAIVAIGRPFPGTVDPCKDPTRCAVVRENTAGAVGGAIFVITDVAVSVHGTLIEGNSAPHGGAGAIYQTSSINLDSTVVAGNSGQFSVFRIAGPTGSLTLGNVTAYGNTTTEGAMIEATDAAATIRVLSSVFDQNSSTLFGSVAAGASVQVDCVMASTLDFFGTLVGTWELRALYLGDPKLANPLAGNYQLRSISPAIDHCDTTEWVGGEHDLDGQARTLDSGLPDVLGPRDLGADECCTIFEDGFETGNTSRWTS